MSLLIVFLIPFYSNADDVATITLDPNGGIFTYDNTTSIKNLSYPIGYKAVINAKEYKCEKEGYKFLGWKDKNSTDGGIIYGYITVEKGMEFIAVWAEEYDLTFDANGGYFSKTTDETIKTFKSYKNAHFFCQFTNPNYALYYNGNDISIEIYRDDEEYVFLGWKINDTDEVFYKDDYVINGTTVFTAQWGKLCNVCWDYNGGKKSKNAEENATCHYENDLLTMTDEKIYRDDAILIGWKVNDNLSDTIYKIGESYTLIGDTTFIAQWEMLPCVKYMYDEKNTRDIAYIKKGTEIIIDNNLSQYEYKSEYANSDELLSNNAYIPEKKLLGWKVEGDSSNKIYINGDKYIVNEDVTFIAVYEETTQDNKEETEKTQDNTITNNNNTSNSSEDNSEDTVRKTTELKVIEPETIQKSKITLLKNNKKKAFTVKWKKIDNSKGYEFQYALNKKFTKNKKSKSTNKLTLTIKKLKKDKTYYVRVRAYNPDSSGIKVYGEWSAIKKVKIKK